MSNVVRRCESWVESREGALAAAGPIAGLTAGGLGMVGLSLVMIGTGLDAGVTWGVGFAFAGLGSLGVGAICLLPIYSHLKRFGDSLSALATAFLVGAGLAAVAEAFLGAVTFYGMAGSWTAGVFDLATTATVVLAALSGLAGIVTERRWMKSH